MLNLRSVIFFTESIKYAHLHLYNNYMNFGTANFVLDNVSVISKFPKLWKCLQ